MEWFFSGLGTTIVSFIIGIIGGGLVGYRIGVKKNTRQIQKAKNNSTQTQVYIGMGNDNVS